MSGSSDGLSENDGSRFDRLPATAAEREVAGRATREAVLDFWDERYGRGGGQAVEPRAVVFGESVARFAHPPTSNFAQKKPPVSFRWG